MTVQAQATLLDTDRAGSVNQIGTQQIQDRLTSLPGRSIQDLVNTQPGWLYEGNAVLHPRGSEYQTQFVVDGIPLTDNRSPSFGPEIGANDVESMTIYTAGFPAEYGRKMGGVVELNTLPDPQSGFHGQFVLSGGSYQSAGISAQGEYSWGKNALGFSASGALTDHYLNPVVPNNFTNTGTIGDFSANYQRDLTPNDRLNFIVRYELSRYLLPNEIVQQTWCYAPGQTTGPPCQQQNANNFETMAVANYRHIFSSNVVGNFRPDGAQQRQRFLLQRSVDADHSVSAQLVQRAVFQRPGHASTRGATSGRSGSSRTIPSCTRTSITTSPIRRNSIPGRR